MSLEGILVPKSKSSSNLWSTLNTMAMESFKCINHRPALTDLTWIELTWNISTPSCTGIWRYTAQTTLIREDIPWKKPWTERLTWSFQYRLYEDRKLCKSTKPQLQLQRPDRRTSSGTDLKIIKQQLARSFGTVGWILGFPPRFSNILFISPKVSKKNPTNTKHFWQLISETPQNMLKSEVGKKN
jgi:hypothetical protein